MESLGEALLAWGQAQPWWDADCRETFDTAVRAQADRLAARQAWQRGDPPLPLGPPADRHHDGSERHPDGTAGYLCWTCRDCGRVRREVPVHHPDFGKAHHCGCQSVGGAAFGARFKERRANSFLPPTLDACTLENFIQVKGSANGLAAAQNWRHAWEQGAAGWLVLWGSTGRGKTHLLGALANRVLLSSHCLWADVPWYLEQIAANQFAQADEWLRSLLQAPVLVFDEFGSQSTAEWARQKLELVVVERYAAGRPTLFGMTCSAEELRDWAPRVASRLGDKALVTEAVLTCGDYRLRRTA